MTDLFSNKHRCDSHRSFVYKSLTIGPIEMELVYGKTGILEIQSLKGASL